MPSNKADMVAIIMEAWNSAPPAFHAMHMDVLLGKPLTYC